MPSADVRFEGLDELYAELKALPKLLLDGVEAIVKGTAELMAREVRAQYEQHFKMHTGELTRDIVVEKIGPLTYIVVNRSRKAHLLEFGTASRFTHETGAARGRIEQRPVFVPLAMKYRRQIVERIKVLLESTGAKVVGSDDSIPLLGAA